MKRLGQLVYCWKYACDGRKTLVKRQKYCSTANSVLCISERIQGQVSTGLISFNLMRPGWIPATCTSLRNAGRGKRLLV